MKRTFDNWTPLEVGKSYKITPKTNVDFIVTLLKVKDDGLKSNRFTYHTDTKSKPVSYSIGTNYFHLPEMYLMEFTIEDYK